MLQKIRENLERVVLGKPEAVQLALVALLAKGHLLIEDVPGVGKTLLATALSRSLGCTFERIQCTSDLLPSDVLGVSIFNQVSRQFEYKQGPIFANLVLVDEINRTSPKTQSALLQAMSEWIVSVDGTTYALPQPFMVLATQNPLEQHGTFSLPDSQLDRFMSRMHMGYPGWAAERQLLKGGDAFQQLKGMAPVCQVQDVLDLQAEVGRVQTAEPIFDYIMRIVEATRTVPELKCGVSPRGALALLAAVKARAMVEGRRYAIPDDVKALAVPVLAHRVMFANRLPVPEQERYFSTLLTTISVPL